MLLKKVTKAWAILCGNARRGISGGSAALLPAQLAARAQTGPSCGLNTHQNYPDCPCQHGRPKGSPRDLAIAPVPLYLGKRDPRQVAIGSYG